MSAAMNRVTATVRGRPTFLGIFWMFRENRGYRSFTQMSPKIPQKKEYIRLVRPPRLKAESLYSQDTVPNMSCCKKLHRYSNPPPMTMLERKIMLSFWLYMW